MAQGVNATSVDVHGIHQAGHGRLQNEHPEQSTKETRESDIQKDTSPDLVSSLRRELEDLDAGNYPTAQPGLPESLYAASVYKETMRNGLLALLGLINIPGSQSWEDAVDYCRAVIECPQDTSQRANAKWTRSCSDLCQKLKERFGPGIVAAARSGCTAFVRDHYQGDSLSIAHVDKKTNMRSLILHQNPSFIFHHESSFLAIACYEITALCCSIVTSAWQPPKEAVKSGMISHVAVSDDYHAFTTMEYETRVRMVALSVGVAYKAGGQAVNVLVDGAALQAIGSGDQLTVEAVMAWRAVGGCTTPYSDYLWGRGSLEDGLVAPELMMAMHDLLDWRCDTAAQNHENGVSAVYGLGVEDAFHTYLEAMLHRASSNPLAGAHAIASIVHLHFTSMRYGSSRYRGDHGKPCRRCEKLLRNITARGGLQWEPTPPPSSFTASEKFRRLGKLVVDTFEPHQLAQTGVSWLQHLITTGEIWLFDALVKIHPVDSNAGWA